MRDRSAGVVIVGHDVYEIEQRYDPIQLDVRDLRRPRRCGDCQLVMMIVFLSLLIESAPQLRQQQSEVLLVRRALDISLEPTLHGELPVDVDAVEQGRPAANEKIDRRTRESAPRRIGEGGIGKSRRAAPTSDGDDQFEMRVPHLQPAQLGEVSPELRGNRGTSITDPDVDASIAEHHGPIRPDQGESVEDVGELFRWKVGDRSALAPHTPGREIPDDARRRQCNRGCVSTIALIRRNEGEAERKSSKEKQTCRTHGSNLLDNSKRWL